MATAACKAIVKSATRMEGQLQDRLVSSQQARAETLAAKPQVRNGCRGRQRHLRRGRRGSAFTEARPRQHNAGQKT